MGRFGSLFKKSEKEKSESNPYAQQPPTAQSSPPPQYDQYTQYNSAQYNDNQSISPAPVGAPSGLPSGPRPGGLPSRVASGYGNGQSPPPQYSPDPAQPSPSGSQRSPYGGGSPYLNGSSTSMGPGFSKEKYGAQDGVGKSRFEPATSPYASSATPPLQSPGGYGNLGASSSGDLFANYKRPSQQATSPSGQPPYGTPGQDGESQMMSEEDREEAEIQEKKAQIIQTIKDTRDAAARSEAKVNDALARALAMTQQTFEQGERLRNAEKNATAAGREIAKGKVNLSALDHAQRMLDFAGNSKTAIQMREEKKMEYDHEQQAEVEAIEREEREARARYAQVQAIMERQNQPRPRTLGAGASKASAFEFEDEEFEDDTGEQRMHNQQIREHQEAIVHGLRQLNGVLKIQGQELERQVEQTARMTERTERNNEGLWRNRVHLESKYGK
ncbi:hypothetical protein VTG60DRAFT_2133 [Thermothelomyces hinnuleus]